MRRDKAGRQRKRAYGHALPDGQAEKTLLGQCFPSKSPSNFDLTKGEYALRTDTSDKVEILNSVYQTKVVSTPSWFTRKNHLLSSSARKKAINSTRLYPGVITRNRTLRSHHRLCRRKFGRGFKKKITTKTSQAAGHLTYISFSQHLSYETNVVGATLEAPTR